MSDLLESAEKNSDAALELAVKLGIDILLDKSRVTACDLNTEVKEDYGDDPVAATRRAIVKVAKAKETVFELVTFNALLTRDEALDFRKKLKHAHLYGLYGVYQTPEKQLWVVMPLKALKVINDFVEVEDDETVR